MSELIANGKVVSFNYTLRNDAGETLDESGPGEPMMYLHGADNIVPGLERKLSGRGVGEKLDVIVEPADGYGERDSAGVQDVPREAFPPDAPLQEGVSFVVETPDGRAFPLWVVSVSETTVRCDANHPLAGVRLHFAVEITHVRDATREEMDHGHPHGPGGHHHH